MKKNIYFGSLAIAALTALTACSTDEIESQLAPQETQVINLTSKLQTTRSATELQTNAVSTAVTIGVFGIYGSDPVTNGDNNEYTVESSGTLSAKTSNMTWPAAETTPTVNIYAYAPYQSGWEGKYNAANSFSVKTDQSSDANYLASDLLWAKASQAQTTANEAIPLSFAHKLARIQITIKKGADAASTNLNGAKIYITNTLTSTTLKPSDGTLGAASGTAEDILIATLSSDLTAGSGSATAYGIVVPQNLAADTKFVKIVTDGSNSSTLVAKLESAATIESGKSYDFTATIGSGTAVELKLGSVSLGDWGTGTSLGDVTANEVVSLSIGDYILSDGTFMKKADYSSATDADKAKIVAVIFSTESKDAGYDGYAVYTGGAMTGKKWGSKTLIGTAIAGGSETSTLIANALADYSGLSTTKAVKAISDYSSTYTAFDFSGCTNVSSASNLSGWFMPSFGQMIDIVQNLGNVSGIKTTIGALTSTNDAEISTDMSFLTTINAYKTGTADIISSSDGGTVYVTTSENSADNVWILKFLTSKWQLSRQAGKDGGSRYVLPIIAYKQ